ncbi:MAG: DUF448 domain-containing protein [Campylobacteraceae bacterium]|nr:DUF448 domain-containing protein [Campylobacteraceae bacterium]
MCITCRQRTGKSELLRLQCQDKKLVLFNGDGRSFYICHECIRFGILEHNDQTNRLEKKIKNSLNRECKSREDYIFQLKEILTNVR